MSVRTYGKEEKRAYVEDYKNSGEPFLHPKLFEMVKFCKNKGIRTVIFTSGIKKTSEMPDETIKYIKDKCQRDLLEIEEHEPWNDRLKRNVYAYYKRMLDPGAFTSITRQELEMLKKLGLDKIVFDWQALDEVIDNQLMGRKGLKPIKIQEYSAYHLV